MKEVIKASKKLLQEAKDKRSKDMLLDKFTLRFIKYVDIDAALAWIKEEEEVGDTVPQNIKNAFPGANPSQTTLYDLQKAFAGSHQNLVLFVDNDYNEWDYDGKENGWRPQLMNNFVMKSDTTTFCVMESDPNAIVEPVMAMIREFKAWAKGGDVRIKKNPIASKGLYPLAFIDGCLYFTNSKEHAQLNVQWGNDTMFFVKVDNPISSANILDLSYKPSTKLIKLTEDDHIDIVTDELGSILQNKSNGLISQFIDYTKNNEGNLIVKYQDEHLKSIIGMVLTIQTINHFVTQIGKDFSIEYNVESYRDDRGNAESISSNQPTSEQRDLLLKDMTNSWLSNLNGNNEFVGTLVPVVSMERRTLTHWRELSFEYGHKKLSIYPDGGFINEWIVGRQPNGVFYNSSNTEYDSRINLFRNKEIKFDVTIEDI